MSLIRRTEVRVSNCFTGHPYDASLRASVSCNYLDFPPSSLFPVSPSAALEPHLSLWAQCTLPKAVFKVYGQDQFARDLLLTAVLEDSNTSVDIQEVYSKIKVKIGTFEVKHFVRKLRGDPWSAGPFLGTVVTSTPETITSSVQIVHDRVAYASISPATNFFAPLPRPLDKSRGFLALTFTSALCQNVQSKIKQGGQGRHPDDAAAAAAENLPPRRYLHEICLKVQPCDVVLHSPLMVSIAKIINIDPLAKLYTTLRPSATPVATLADVDPRTSPERVEMAKGGNMGLSIFTSQLPLLYVTASSLRIFMPLEEKTNDGVESNPGKMVHYSNKRKTKGLFIRAFIYHYFHLQ